VVSCAQMTNTKKSASNEGGDKGAVDIAIYIYTHTHTHACTIDTTNYV